MAKTVIEKFTSDLSGEEIPEDAKSYTVSIKDNLDPSAGRMVLDISEAEFKSLFGKATNLRTEKPRGRKPSNS